MNTHHLKMEECFEVNRTIEDCFRYIVDFSTIQEWDHTVVHSEKLSDGPLQKGSLFEVVLKIGMVKTPMAYEITEYDYPKRAVLVGEADNFTATDIVELEKIDAVTTRVTWKAEIVFRGIMSKFVAKFESSIQKSGKKTIEGLKTALQNNYQPPSYSSRFKVADNLVFPGMFLFTKFGYQIAKKSWNPISTFMDNKHVVLTGATSGLGLATAYALAHKGAILTLVARNESKAQQVKSQIIKKTGNTNIHIEIADMSEMKSIRLLTDRLITKGQTIDVLINNAGALFSKRQMTSEGLEMSFALLLLGPYLLTQQLMPLLGNSNNARVINISSGGMYSQKLRVNDLEYKKGKYDGSVAYARAKRGLVILTEEWSKKYKDSSISFNSMHPGWADTPGVVDALPTFYKLTKMVLRTPEQGADTIVWMACAKEASTLNGQFLLDRIPHTTHLMNGTKENDADRTALTKRLKAYSEMHELASI